MKINQIVQETTTAGSITPGAQHGFVKMQTRNPSVSMEIQKQAHLLQR
jgi:hypothetical protein